MAKYNRVKQEVLVRYLKQYVDKKMKKGEKLKYISGLIRWLDKEKDIYPSPQALSVALRKILKGKKLDFRLAFSSTPEDGSFVIVEEIFKP